jgi:hypothetical protein
MDMGMMFELLIPTMQHTEEAYFCAQMLRIACDLQQRLCAEPKEQIVNHPLVLQSEWCQFMRQSEDDMDVACG